jgi:hypothetical protein
MQYTGGENHFISLAEAAEMTERYRKDAGTDAVLAGFFGKDTILRILSQANCCGIRIYYAKSEDNSPQFVITGVNREGDDLYDGELAEYAIACPPNCSKENPLNSSTT